MTWERDIITLIEDARRKLDLAEQIMREQGQDNRPDPLRQIRWRNLVIDTCVRHVTVAGQPLPLTQREWQVLRYLVLHRNQWCRYQQIAQSIWGMDIDGRGSPETLKTHVCHLRKKLRPLNIIESLPGSGYRCNLPEE
jgi:DNA-binding response OmpR family regulator